MAAPLYFKPPRPSAYGSPAPEPLNLTVSRVARFDEVDALGIVWHGRYASYFEDARVAFGRHYGIGYQTMHAAGVVAPIKRMTIDYEAPLLFEQECRITASLFWNEAARLDFEYAIHDLNGKRLTLGCTVQLFLTLAGDLCYAKPPFYEDFCQKWRAGAIPTPWPAQVSME